MSLVQQQVVTNLIEHYTTAEAAGRGIVNGLLLGYELFAQCDMHGVKAKLYVPRLSSGTARVLRDELVFRQHLKPVAQLTIVGDRVVGTDTFAAVLQRFRDCKIGIAIAVYDDTTFNIIGGN